MSNNASEKPAGPEKTLPQHAMLGGELSVSALELAIEKIKSKGKLSKKDLAEVKRLKSLLSKVYNENKALVMKFEESNFERLVFLRSTGGFYKLVGHSAIFYNFSIAPKLNLRSSLRPDGDFEDKSEHGIVSVRDVTRIGEKLKTLKIKPMRTKNKSGDILMYKIPWKYTEKQLEEYINDNAYQIQKFNHVVMVENAFPTLYLVIDELVKAIYENVRKMPGPIERETLGYDLIRIAVKMKRIYIEISNGRLNEMDGLNGIREALNFLKSQTKVIADLKIWTPRVYARIGDNMIKIQDMTERLIKEI